jgi:hypothetical protein
MILEMARLPVKASEESAFEAAFAQAQKIIAAHREDFRHSADHQTWRGLLHRFYEPGIAVAHFATVAGALN